MKELSQSKCYEIANVCYANVSSWFSSMCNPDNRGPNFKWENFSQMMVNMSDSWHLIHHIKGDKIAVKQHINQYAKEISDKMVKQSGFISEQNRTF